MRVLERLPHLRVKDPAAHSQIARRSKDVQHTRALVPGTGPPIVQNARLFKTSLVAGLPNEGHYLLLLLYLRWLCWFLCHLRGLRRLGLGCRLGLGRFRFLRRSHGFCHGRGFRYRRGLHSG